MRGRPALSRFHGLVKLKKNRITFFPVRVHSVQSMASPGWEIIARPPSQNIKNGSTACTGVATVFCLSANPDNVLATDFKTVVKIGVSMWAKWHKKVGKATNSVYCSVEELIQNLDEIRRLIDANEYEYRIFSGFVIKEACASEEAFYLRDAVMKQIKPGMCAVICQERVKDVDGDVLKAPRTLSLCRSTEGTFYLFDSHASKDLDKGMLIRFESPESLWQWFLTDDGFYVNMLEQQYDKLSTAQRQDYANVLSQFYYRLTVFNKKRRPSPRPTGAAVPVQLDAANDDATPVAHGPTEAPDLSAATATATAVSSSTGDMASDADDVVVVGTCRGDSMGYAAASDTSWSHARRARAEAQSPVLSFTLNCIGAKRPYGGI